MCIGACSRTGRRGLFPAQIGHACRREFIQGKNIPAGKMIKKSCHTIGNAANTHRHQKRPGVLAAQSFQQRWEGRTKIGNRAQCHRVFLGNGFDGHDLFSHAAHREGQMYVGLHRNFRHCQPGVALEAEQSRSDETSHGPRRGHVADTELRLHDFFLGQARAMLVSSANTHADRVHNCHVLAEYDPSIPSVFPAPPSGKFTPMVAPL